jgi:hypothetical protein
MGKGIQDVFDLPSFSNKNSWIGHGFLLCMKPFDLVMLQIRLSLGIVTSCSSI